MKPKQADAQLLYADGTWRPARVLGWLRLDIAHKQPITQRWIFRLVQIQLADARKHGSSTTRSIAFVASAGDAVEGAC